MIVYWILLLCCPLTASIGSRVSNPHYKSIYNSKEHRKYAILAMFPIVFFIGLRSGFADTGAYIFEFKNSRYNTIESFRYYEGRDIGFALITSFFKNILLDDFHILLFAVTLFSCFSVGKLFWKYSPDFALSLFLFIATAQFTYLTNGIRQFLALSILLTVLPAFLQKKYILCIIAAIIASLIHLSIIIIIPLYFLCKGSPFSKKTVIAAIILSFVAVFIADRFLILMDIVFDDTQYTGYSTAISGTIGSNIVRLIVALVPVVLALIKRKEIIMINDTVVNYFVNTSIMNVAFMVMSTMISGIFFGRIAEYFDIFNLVLYPILLVCFYKGRLGKFLRLLLIFLYTFWFWYQMVYIWEAYYISDVLGIFVR